MAAGHEQDGERTRDARSAFFEIEPELRNLEGLLIACRILGEAEDHVEPTAIGAIARCGLEALDRATASWRVAIEDVETT